MEPDDGNAQVQVQWDPSYLPPLFSGKSDEDFLTWVRKVELAVATYPHGAPPVAQLLGNRLDGDHCFFLLGSISTGHQKQL